MVFTIQPTSLPSPNPVQVKFTITSASTASKNYTFNVLVTGGTNQPPTISSVSGQTVVINIGQTLPANVKISATDTESDPLTFNAFLTESPTLLPSFVTLAADTLVWATVTAGNIGSYFLKVYVRDGH